MCGTVGLFTGCAAAAFCPVSQLSNLESNLGAETGGLPEYRSAFKAWDQKASVRSSPRRMLAKEDVSRLFPPDLVPIASHPKIASLPSELRARVLTQHLYRYLHFTAKLEYLVVNHVVLGIAHGSVKVPVPEQMRFDAFKIYCDEAYHALFSVDLIRQVRELTGEVELSDEEPYFMVRLGKLKARFDPDQGRLIDLLFTIVSETLISATLTDVARSQTVAPAVMQTVRDHALDEGRHHAYFSIFLHYLWATLDGSQRRFASHVLPELIDVFLRPDTQSIRDELLGYGLHPDDADQVLAETFTEAIQTEYSRTTASRLLGYLAEVGALDDPGAQDALHAQGLRVPR